jgi:UDP-2,3-diacylglucosamine hydrolase
LGRLAILAGGGELPLIAMKEAISTGEDPIFLSIKESSFDPGEYSSRSLPVYLTKIGEIFKLCKKNDVDRLLMVGKVSKDILLKGYKFDLKALYLLSKMINKNDYTFFALASKEFEKINVSILSQKSFLQSLLLPEGRYTKKKLSKDKLEDIAYGLELARNMATLDIGQTVVVTKKMALAIEAIEGTDETIKRGGLLSRKRGAVVCKSSKRNQDERFDLPTVGTNTLEIMLEHSCDTLVIRANETLVVTPERVIEFAEKNKIHILSIDNSEPKLVNKNYISREAKPDGSFLSQLFKR